MAKTGVAVSQRQWVAFKAKYIRNLDNGHKVKFCSRKQRDRWLSQRYSTPLADRVTGFPA